MMYFSLYCVRNLKGHFKGWWVYSLLCLLFAWEVSLCFWEFLTSTCWEQFCLNANCCVLLRPFYPDLWVFPDVELQWSWLLMVSFHDILILWLVWRLIKCFLTQFWLPTLVMWNFTFPWNQPQFSFKVLTSTSSRKFLKKNQGYPHGWDSVHPVWGFPRGHQYRESGSYGTVHKKSWWTGNNSSCLLLGWHAFLWNWGAEVPSM